MGDDDATAAQLRAELRQYRDLYEAARAEIERRDRALTQTLEQQAATAEVMGVIASSPTDLQSVLNEVAESTARLLEADNVLIHGVDGDAYRVMATNRASTLARVLTPMPIDRQTFVGRAIADRVPINVPDVEAVVDEEFPSSAPLARSHGVRSALAVPLLREGAAIGAIFIRRDELRPFTEQHVALLGTFADQAVIAIENARLLQELGQRNAELQESNRRVTQALEQQTATAEVLRVVASRPTDATDVLQAIADAAARLCQVDNVGIGRVVGDEIERMANSDRIGRPLLEIGARTPLDHHSWAGRAILERRTIRHHDLETILDQEYPARAPSYREQQELPGAHPIRSLLVLPLLREDGALGVMVLIRREVRPFTDQQIALLESFADQALIAIENARLFEELEQRNRDLAEALEQQTATAEVLRVIASSQNDLQAVLDATVASACRLVDAEWMLISQLQGQDLVVAADVYGERVSAEQQERIAHQRRASSPPRLSRRTLRGRALLERRTIQHVNTDWW